MNKMIGCIYDQIKSRSRLSVELKNLEDILATMTNKNSAYADYSQRIVETKVHIASIDTDLKDVAEYVRINLEGSKKK